MGELQYQANKLKKFMFEEGKRILVLPMCRVADYGCCCVLCITDQSLIFSTLNCVPNFLAVVAAAQNMEANVGS